MGAPLLDERNIALGGPRTIHQQVARARHGHEIAKSRENDLAVFALREWSVRSILLERDLSASPPADGTGGRPGEDETDTGMLREKGGRSGMPALDFLEEQWLGRIEKIHESIGPGRDDANVLR